MAAGTPPFAESGPREYNPHATASAARRSAETRLLSIPGVTGMGEGQDALGNKAWIVYIIDRAIAATLPKSVDGRPVIAEVTGEIDAQPE